MSVTTDDLADLMNRVLRAQLWTAAESAAFLKYSAQHFRMFIATRSDFPKALHLPGKGKTPNLRYRPDDVRDWADKFVAKS